MPVDRKQDPEILAISRIHKILASLPTREARVNVLSYLGARIVSQGAPMAGASAGSADMARRVAAFNEAVAVEASGFIPELARG